MPATPILKCRDATILKTFEKVVVYASEWKNLVEIVDIYEQRYYVSCTQADELVALLQSE